MADPFQITPTELMRVIGTPDARPIIDVCIDSDFNADPYLIPGAIRHAHTDVPALVEKLAGGPAIVVCQKGRKLSQGVVALLRAAGVSARYLTGGMYAWRDTPGTVRIPASVLPGTHRWITHAAPDPDHLISLWLVCRFVDPGAQFLFVDAAEVDSVADRFDGVSLEGFVTPLVHGAQQGTFHAMLARFELHLPALAALAATKARTTSLAAISDGFRCRGLDDNARLDAMLPVFDALFANASVSKT